MSAENQKIVRKRCTISLETKVKILDRLKKGEKLSVVAKTENLNEATIRTIKKNEEKIREYASIVPLGVKRSFCSTNVSIMNTEKALSIWIDDCVNKRVPLSGNIIKQKALKIYKHLQEGQQTTTEQQSQSFCASKGWMERFKARYSLHNIRLQGESASADVEAARQFTTELQKIVKDECYAADQIFNADETGLNWKKLPSRTYISKNQNSMPGFKMAKERITLLLCSNASGDCCMKPLFINKSMNPRALKNLDKEQLPVYWRANNRAWITSSMFADWFRNCFVPDVERYLKKKNLSFKVLLLLDNAPGHPKELEHPNVKIIFLPPNTTSLIQPLDQGVISTFKAYYIRMSFQSILDNLEAAENKTLTQVWKEFSILDCINTVSSSISDLKASTLNASWKALLPDMVYEDSNIPCKHTEYNQIINVAHSLCGTGFDDMSAEDVDELFLEKKTLDEEDLVRLLEESNSNSVTTEDTENYENVSNQNFSVDDVQYALHLANKLEMFLTKRDPCKVRKTTFAAQLKNCIKPYENYLEKLQHRNEPSCSTARYSDEDEPSDVDIRPPTRKYPRITTFLDDSSDED